MRAYLDNNATSPIDPRVADVMDDVNRTIIGNPSSLHAEGRAARRLIEDARSRIAAAIGARDREILFTSSATEANNLAIASLVRSTVDRDTKKRVLASPIEHPSVLEPIKALDSARRCVAWLGVSDDGVITFPPSDEDSTAWPFVVPPAEIAFVTMMWANNETGALQPVRRLSSLLRPHRIPLHCDAVQGFGKQTIDVEDVHVDYMTISGHKIHGPKGVGVLFVRGGHRVTPLLIGGGQERERRAGTENVAAIAGLAKAIELSRAELEANQRRRLELESHLLDELGRVWPDAAVNTKSTQRMSGVLSLKFPGWSNEVLLMNLDLRGVCVSLGAACSSGAAEPSHVLEAMGLSLEENLSTIRVSMSHMNSSEDISRFIEALADIRSSVPRHPRSLG